MAQKVFAGITIEVTDDGYMANSSQWTKEIAAELAKEEGIADFTDKHLAVVQFLRDRVQQGEALTIRSINKSGVVDVKEFYQLFPGAPLKKASKIAGVAKPASCV